MTTADDLRATVPTIQASAVQMEADQEILELTQAALDAAKAEIARLEAELAECQAGEAPVTTTFGAYAGPQGKASWDAYQTNVGPAAATRLFYGSGSSVEAAGVPFPGVTTIASIHSRDFSTGARPTHAQVAAGAIDAKMTTFASKLKTYLDKHPDDEFIMSFVAEPDVKANQDLGSAADHVKAYRRVRERFDPVVQVPWAMILTGTTFSTNSSTRNPGMWWDDSYDLVGIDPYNMGYTDATWKPSLEPETTVAADFADVEGVGLIVPEWGSVWHDTDPNRRAGWVTHQAEVFRELGVTVATYFDSNKTGETGNSNDHRDFRLTGPGERAAYRAVLEGA